MNKEKIKKVLEGQIEYFAELIKKMNIPEPLQICIDNFDNVDESVLEEIKTYKNKPIVYIIMLRNKLNNSSSPETIEELFNKKRTKYRNLFS